MIRLGCVYIWRLSALKETSLLLVIFIFYCIVLIKGKCKRKRKQSVGTRLCENFFMAGIKIMLLHLPTQIFFPIGGDRALIKTHQLQGANKPQ